MFCSLANFLLKTTLGNFDQSVRSCAQYRKYEDNGTSDNFTTGFMMTFKEAWLPSGPCFQNRSILCASFESGSRMTSISTIGMLPRVLFFPRAVPCGSSRGTQDSTTPLEAACSYRLAIKWDKATCGPK